MNKIEHNIISSGKNTEIEINETTYVDVIECDTDKTKNILNQSMTGMMNMGSEEVQSIKNDKEKHKLKC